MTTIIVYKMIIQEWVEKKEHNVIITAIMEVDLNVCDDGGYAYV